MCAGIITTKLWYCSFCDRNGI